MTLEQVAEIGWDTKLPPSLEDALTVLETASKSYVFDDLGVDFLNMDLAFKRLEEKQASEKTEERLAVLSKVFDEIEIAMGEAESNHKFIRLEENKEKCPAPQLIIYFLCN